MIIFYGQKKTGEEFKIDLTALKISFVEENNLFYNYFVKNYSFPFSSPLLDEISKKLGFIDDLNAVNYSIKYPGNLLIDNDFKDAILILKKQKGNKLEGIFVYGKENIPLMEKNLSEIPFAINETDDLLTFAKNTLTKSYPEVDFNFPMVYYPTFNSKTYYHNFKDYINHYDNDFLTNNSFLFEGENVVNNNNAIVPMPYLISVIKEGFKTGKFVVLGDFVNDPAIKKTLLFSEKHLIRYQSDLPERFSLKHGVEIWKGLTRTTYTFSAPINFKGTYTINGLVNIPNDLRIIEIKINYGDEQIFRSTTNFNETISLNVDDVLHENFTTTIILEKEGGPTTLIGDISSYNLFSIDFEGGELNIFPNTFSISQVLPEMTFGSFLNKIRNYFNLDIDIQKNKVFINFVDSSFTQKREQDERDFEIEAPDRLYKNKKMYVLKSGDNEVLVDENGKRGSREGYVAEEITTINSGVEMLDVISTEKGFTAFRKENLDSDLQLIFYDGLKNNIPLTVEKINGRSNKIDEVYQNYWKKWLFFRLRSETYKDKFKAHILDSFKIDSLRFKYSKKHIYKKIRRTRIDEENWEIEVESETL